MAATAFLMSVGDAANGPVRVEVDWASRSWATAGQWGWGRVPMPTKGPLRTNNGTLWLMEPNGPGVVVMMDRAPAGPADIANTNGSGTLCDTNDRRWPSVKLAWSRDTGSGQASSAAVARLRDEIEAICNANLPADFKLQEPANCCVAEKGKVKGPDRVTGCGQFPAWVLTRTSGRFIRDKVLTEKGTPWAATVSTMQDTIRWEEMSKIIGKMKNRSIWKLYDPTRPDIRPKKGDIYLLKKTEKKNADFAHVGIVIDASGTAWKTADAGQGKGFAVGFRRRTFDPVTAKIQGEEGVLQYFKGWVDLEGLLE